MSRVLFPRVKSCLVQKKRARVGNEIRFFLFSRNGKDEDKRAYFLLLASSNWMTTSSNNVQQSDMLAAQ